MKKKKTILLVLAIAVFGAANLMKPFQNANACEQVGGIWLACHEYLTTGECSNPMPPVEPSGAYPVEGEECWIWIPDQGLQPTGAHAIDCEWAVVGECTPQNC